MNHLRFAIIAAVIFNCIACGNQNPITYQGGITVTNPPQKAADVETPTPFFVKFSSTAGYSLQFSSELQTLSSDARGIKLQSVNNSKVATGTLEVSAPENLGVKRSPGDLKARVDYTVKALKLDESLVQKISNTDGQVRYEYVKVSSERMERHWWNLGPNGVIVEASSAAQPSSNADVLFVAAVATLKFDLTPPRIQSLSANSEAVIIRLSGLESRERSEIFLQIRATDFSGEEIKWRGSPISIGQNTFQIPLETMGLKEEMSAHPDTRYFIELIGAADSANNWMYLTAPTSESVYESFEVPADKTFVEVPAKDRKRTRVKAIVLKSQAHTENEQP